MRTRLRLAVLTVAFSLLAGAAAAQGPTRPAAYNVLYGAQDEGRRRLDVYVPEGMETPAPVVMYFHGTGGDKADVHSQNLPQLAAQAGAAVVAVNYSLELPDAYADAWCAVSWVQANATTYHLDPAKIIPFGVSYGALPAAMLAAQDDPSALTLDCPHPPPDPSAIHGMVSLAGLLPSSTAILETAFPNADIWQDEAAARELAGLPPDEWRSPGLPEAARDFLSLFPAAWVNHYQPPHLLIQGAGDSSVPYEDAYAYAELLGGSDTNVTVLVDRIAGHVPGPAVFDRELVAFLRHVLADGRFVPNQRRPVAYNMLYGAEDEGRRRLDVYVPEDAAPPYPVVLMFHGSGADKSDMAEFGLPDIAARAGAATVAVTYSSESPLTAYADAACALAWVQANGADYGLDPARIVTLGHSYGALPATMLAVQDDPAALPAGCPHPPPDLSQIDGVITVAGLVFGSDSALEEFAPLVNIPLDGALTDAVRAAPPDQWLALDLPPAAREALSDIPMAQIDANEPPHLLIHGEVDETLPFQQALDYARILSRNRTSATVVLDRYSGHVPPPFAYDREMIAFLQRAFNQPDS